jgi:2-keto-4-pentenoate hydratase/2-oxohepta-3-ene-1,7-dioic acid hydratase in catechol pathway
MRRTAVAAFTVLLAAGGSPLRAQGPSVAEPFKLGTFDIEGQTRIGIVLRDGIVVELEAANRELERRPTVARLPMPADMKELAGRYEHGVAQRLYQIVNTLAGEGRLASGKRPQYARELASVRTLAPILYPTTMLNAAANYYGHVGEMGTPEEQRKAAEERRRDRGLAYLFLKPSGVVIGNGDDILLPRGRDKIDWECELAIVIGRPAKHVSAARANDHIFGYTIELDMSDRGGRPEKERRFGGSDWLIGKGHDTFAPLGPFIVPKEFVKDPMNVSQRLTVNGKLMQDSRSSDMIHNVWELIEYGSSILTLRPGDVIAAGSPAGTGMSRSVRPEQVFLRPGDKIVATIEGIGTLTHTARADSPGATAIASK